MIKVVSYIILVLFCWVIYPYKWIRWIAFYVRRYLAIRTADEMHNLTGRRYFVIQNGRKFIVRDKRSARKKDVKIKKKIPSYLDWDYRNAIIYRTK